MSSKENSRPTCSFGVLRDFVRFSYKVTTNHILFPIVAHLSSSGKQDGGSPETFADLLNKTLLPLLLS